MIIFEGCDRSGKSTLSVAFSEYINNKYRDQFGLLRIDPHLGDFIWTKEPLFTTEEADRLNSPEFTDEFKRECLFFESRFRHQDMLAGRNVVCDRYIWSGIAYAYVFSPHCYMFAKELYTSPHLFIQPDLHVYVNTPVEICYERDTSVGFERLQKISDAYDVTRRMIKSPIIEVASVGGEEKALEELMIKFDEFVGSYQSDLPV